MELSKSKVVFDEVGHKYTLGDKIIGGVTPIVSWMFPDTYKGVSQETLDMAAERGHAIHSECQMFNDFDFEPKSEEGKAYVRLLEENNLSAIASEYLVDYGENIASAIDVVMGDCSLADIKTTSSIHWDCVTLQLNIYRFMFEKMNKSCSVPKLYVIWLPKPQYGKPQIKEVGKISDEDIKAIIKAYLNGEDSTPLREKIFNAPSEIPSTIMVAMEQFSSFIEQEAQIKKKKDEITSFLKTEMEVNNIKKFENDLFSISYIPESKRKSIDSKALQSEHPDIYDKYIKETSINASVRIKIKKHE